MKFKSSLLILLLLTGVSACSLMQDFVRPKSDLPQQFNLTIDAQQSQQLTGDWWLMYQDEQLNLSVRASDGETFVRGALTIAGADMVLYGQKSRNGTNR